MNRAATFALAPLSLLYGAAAKVRVALYRNKIFRTHRVAMPVISVGNITTGGTGKTPLVEWIARQLAASGRRVCILTRGYRRANPTARVLVSDGDQIVADVIQSGDEALMLAQSLLGKAAIVCDADRVAGADWATKNLKPDVLILDDGFQHMRIARDLDIVTIDATNPWGNGWLLPAGVLREPRSSLRRAGCIVLTRASDAGDADLKRSIGQRTDAPMFSSRTVTRRVIQLDSSEPADEESLLKQPIAAFCGIGNPNAFFQQLRAKGFELRHATALRDHHVYSERDIERLVHEATEARATAFITTAKDAVKLRSLRFPLPCYVAEIEVEIAEADSLRALINGALRGKLRT